MLRLLTMLTVAAATQLASAAEGFLFVTFKGEQTPLTEQIYFAISRDGRTWKALNDEKPVLVSTLGEKGIRDPYVLRSHDGSRFYMVATDLSINRNGDWGRAVTKGSRALLVWESTDLVTWSEPRLVTVAPEGAGCTWAPEAVYDEKNQDYLVFWASTTASDNFKKHRIWACRTKDFKTFGAPFIYIDKKHTTIDTTIVHDGTSYYRFTKDEEKKAVSLESSPELDGPWTLNTQFTLATMTGYEGPQCYLIEPASAGKPPTWGLILDHYAKGRGYQPYVTHDLSSGNFTPAAGFSFPFKFRHGSVLPITKTELEQLEKAYPSKTSGDTAGR